MKNGILSSEFRASQDGNGSPVVVFTFAYMRDNERKYSSIMLNKHISKLTEEDIQDCISKAEQRISGGNSDW